MTHLPRGASAACALFCLLAACAPSATRTAPAPALLATPLAVAGPSAGPLLESIGPEASGIAFVNEPGAAPGTTQGDPSWLLPGADGALAVGDVDGDGLPDVLVVPGVGAERLYRNLGGWRFEDATAAAGLAPPEGIETPGAATTGDTEPGAIPTAGVVTASDASDDLAMPGGISARDRMGGATDVPTGAALADLDGDGDLDLLTTSRDGTGALLRNSEGRFTEASGVGVGVRGAARPAFADYDRDGDLDIYLTSSEPGSGALLRNDGGTFTDVTAEAGLAGASPAGAAVFGDVSGDGWADLYVSRTAPEASGGPAPASSDALFLNQRDGSFLTSGDSVDVASGAAALGDVNEDGRLDILTAGGAVGLLVNAGDPGDGQPVFQNASWLAGLGATEDASVLAVADIDVDGLPDVLVAAGHRLRAFRNAGDLGFEDVSDRWGLGAAGPFVGGVGDGVGAAGVDAAGRVAGVAVSDLDGDGDPDVVVSLVGQAPVVLRNNASAHRVAVRLRGSQSNRLGVGARLELTVEDAASTPPSARSPAASSDAAPPAVRVAEVDAAAGGSATFGLGPAHRVARLLVRWPSGAWSDASDIAANQRLVLDEPPEKAKIPPPPPGTAPQFAEVAPAEMSPMPPALGELAQQLSGFHGPIAIADVDGDGDLDAFAAGSPVVGAAPPRTTNVLLRNEGGELSPWPQPSLEAAGLVTGALWSDVDADGDPDLCLVTSGGPPRVLTNRDGTLVDATEAAGLAGLTGLWGALASGDLDHDGDFDLVAFNRGLNTPAHASPAAPFTDTPLSGPPRSVAHLEHLLLWNDGRGHFTPEALPRSAQLLAAGAVAVADVDDDGHDDLIVAGSDASSRGLDAGTTPAPADASTSRVPGLVLRGDGTGRFTAVEAVVSGLWLPRSPAWLVGSDADGDGWWDLLAGINGRSARTFHNDGVEDDAGLGLRLEGPEGNPTGIGARVTVTGPDGLVMHREVRAGVGFPPQDDASLAFGLGAGGGAARIEVLWPDGVTQSAVGGAGKSVVVRRADAGD